MYAKLLLGILVTVPLATADQCDPGPPGDDDDTPPACGPEQVLVDGVCAADIPQGWTRIEPGGETICSRGTDYAFFVRRGTVNKLVVGFDGGGACWDTISCSEQSPIFSDSVTADDNPATMSDGILDFKDPENPFSDWYGVFVPYCTGDIHWGDAVVTYPATGDYPEVTIYHKGFVNASAVMSWIYDHFAAPEVIFVTGVSAGSYGSLMFAPYLMDHYPESRAVQSGDSGAGVITQEFLELGLTNWNAVQNIPEFFTELHETPLSSLSLPDVYIAAANYFPGQVYSQYNTAYDENQQFYYEAMGGNPGDWHDLMVENISTIADSAPTFRYFTNWGELHGVLPYPEFYTYQTNGVRIRDWVADLAAGVDVENVMCTDCRTPEYYEP